MQKKGLDCECLGGGRISHQSRDKKIHVYGYSMVSAQPCFPVPPRSVGQEAPGRRGCRRLPFSRWAAFCAPRGLLFCCSGPALRGSTGGTLRDPSLFLFQATSRHRGAHPAYLVTYKSPGPPLGSARLGSHLSLV